MLRQATEQVTLRDQERKALEWQLADLDRLNLQQGEWDALTNDHSRLAHAQALIEGAAQALSALDGDDLSARSLLNRAVNRIRQLQQHDAHLVNITTTLESALI